MVEVGKFSGPMLQVGNFFGPMFEVRKLRMYDELVRQAMYLGCLSVSVAPYAAECLRTWAPRWPRPLANITRPR